MCGYHRCMGKKVDAATAHGPVLARSMPRSNYRRVALHCLYMSLSMFCCTARHAIPLPMRA